MGSIACALGDIFHNVSQLHLQYEIAVITIEGAEIMGTFELDTNWDIAHYVRYVCTYNATEGILAITFVINTTKS